MNQPDHIRMLANSVSTYIDNYEDVTLSSKENKAVLKAREVIIESLEFLKTGTHKEKASTKMLSKLDDTFTNVIDIFAKGEFPSPEIMETIKKRNEDEEPVLKSEPKKKKSKPTKASKATKPKKEKEKAMPVLEREEPKRSVSSKQKEVNATPKGSKDPRDASDISKDLIKFLAVMASQGDTIRTDSKKMKKMMATAIETITDMTVQINTMESRLKKLEKQ